MATVVKTPPVPGSRAVEERTREIGRTLFRQIGRGPSPFDRSWWDDQLMGLTMEDPEVKVQLFRFIDALPTLVEPASVRRHLNEYLEEAGDRVPSLMSIPLSMAPTGPVGDKMLARMARAAATRMARRFITGSTPEEAFRSVLNLRRKGVAFTADLLGEAVITDREAEVYQRTCLDLIRGLAAPLAAEPEIPRIDRDHLGPIPRVNLSLKLTSLTPRFDPTAAEATADRVRGRLRPILREAIARSAFVNVDMEQYAYKDLTYAIFRSTLDEPEFRDYPHFGIVCQAYLRDAEADLRTLRDWAEARGTPVTIRLVKGAYWDYEVLLARQVGWPLPVHSRKWETDACFERCSEFLLDHHRRLRPAFGSHNVRSLAHAMAAAEVREIPIDAYEVQILHGMGDPIRRALIGRGHRVRVYSPYGAMLPGMAYLVRRLLENTSNESFLRASAHGDVPVEELLRNPLEVGTMRAVVTRPRTEAPPEGTLPPFANQAPVDFSRAENRERMRAALDQVRAQLGREYPLQIGRDDIRTDDRLTSESPNDVSLIVGRTAKANRSHADRALTVAASAYPSWSSTPARTRADVLLKAAAIMRSRLFELAAWEVFECAKPWAEATADIDEAIDFCEFYARRMLDLADPRRRDVPGETNRLDYFGRGVAVVIPPWNFPLAIPCGMTVAALVAGCPVVLKPAEQSPVIAWHLVQILREAGAPPEVIQYLPGVGEEVGAALVDDPRTAVVAFTGSKAVGLSINRVAADTKPGQGHVKRVIAEMGGKNAIIIDDDADLDEAVVGVLRSAFGYAGQKCSAASRAVVLDGIYDTFVQRLAEALPSWTVGPADDPDPAIPPVIDAEACDRINAYKQIARAEGRVVAELDVGPLVDRGHYVGPMIVADVAPKARIAREEVFGPILAVIRAKDLDDAIRITSELEYALTAGLYSRSPAHIDRVSRSLRVGNLYINRPCTGALVDRQPFGGFKMSGIGTKAGGPDYLLEFLLARSITENTMRRGFAPDLDELADREPPTPTRR
ncbi:proline dehydrogenase family protein [Tautonia sp. JC769]|uniref:proline dehydrogenase family protein n=1 Tax=Tautonia sp. JC769 TaxID=3232135 RepID=UPI00345AE1FD